MSLARQLIRELEEEPELAALLARRLELTLSMQILKNIEELREDFNKILLRVERIEEEQVKLREDFNKILARVENVEREQVRLADEQKRLAEEQAKLREDFNRILLRVENVERGQVRLAEEQVRLADEQRRLAEEQVRLAQEQAKLREDFNKMLARLERVEKRVDDVWGAVLWGFNQMSSFAGVNFEEFLRKLLTKQLRKAGVLAPGVKLVRSIVEGEEINLFCEEPLIVGEVTARAESTDEVLKLLRKVEIIERKYGKPVAGKMLIILTAPRRIAREIEKLCREYSIELVIGRKL